MDVICRWAERYPDSRFVIWLPPYSILYWDQAARLGRTEAILTALEYAVGRMVAYDNVTVLSFLNAQGIVTDLNFYTDHIHYSGAVTKWMAGAMQTDQWRFWPEVYPNQINELREFVNSYDYDRIFEAET